ncbi:MAG: glycosyltransferase, partial [Planctomycetes bacterium]|nr:glycosyltransferase [Planctomycetota bacterium]
NGTTGGLVQPGDVDGLRKSLQHMVHDHGWRAQAVHEARRRAEEHYRRDTFARRCEAVFERLTADRPTGRSRS